MVDVVDILDCPVYGCISVFNELDFIVNFITAWFHVFMFTFSSCGFAALRYYYMNNDNRCPHNNDPLTCPRCRPKSNPLLKIFGPRRN